MTRLTGRVAMVTGASRGVGRGIAAVLADEGARVYATGRTIEHADLPTPVVRVPCDHTQDDDVAELFARIRREQQRLDILVNVAWGGYERMVENGQFTWTVPFWEQPMHRWNAMMDAGVRAAFVASRHAAPLMISQRSGLIVNISFWPAQKYLGNAIYGISKAATDKFTSDAAHELRPHDVAIVSLYPGMVRTEAVMAAAAYLDLSNSESPEFIGRTVAALAGDADVMDLSGTVVVAAAAAQRYGFSDIDGTRPRPLTLNDV